MAAERRARLHPAALAELIEGAAQYEEQREDRGVNFEKAVERAIALIVSAPERWPLAPRVSPRRGAHRYVLKHFPYDVIYRLVGADELEVVALAHHKRRPGYWAKRW